ncbi:MAG: 4-hydroxythreonine-4-phosphate dehydrogenase PdxA [Eubacteriales bacterium]|nr:4-hydroxythreonine-4-phosphate dehydrogenase PdxA [Eubacteriales bacterium]
MLKPIIAITMGDPSGIGPEIIVKALGHERIYASCRPLVVGSATMIAHAAALLSSPLRVRAVSCVQEAAFSFGSIDVLDQQSVDLSAHRFGVVSAQSGRAAYLAVEEAIRLAMNNEADATVTAPLNKEALHTAGYLFSGHTEIYAALTSTQRYSMLLAHGSLRVVHVSTHISLREACDRCTRERELEVIRLAHDTCRSMGIDRPRIAVAGLNPHAGENGLFGREEIEAICPAVEDAQAIGILAEGPLPADTIFSKARGGLYDVVVAQYHDQGHIPLKLLGFEMDPASGKWKSVAGVNITLGLPIIRTSVDHGTAFDQAGLGTATEESLINAIEYAIGFARVRLQSRKES